MKRFLALTTLFTLLCGAGVYSYCHGRVKGNPDKALPSFREGELAAAERILRNSDTVTFPLALYHSYLATASGHFKESDYFLQTILRDGSYHQSEELLVQSYLTQAINAYFENGEQEITPLIDRARRLNSGSSVILFFEGLSNYVHKQYSEALRFWAAYTSEKGWMDTVIDRCFPLSWRQLHVAHCLTEEGDVLSSREILEKESHLLESDPHNYHQLAMLFLGLSYLREAHEAPVSSRGSYYKLARFYFERSGREIRFDRERLRACEHLGEEATALLASASNDEMRQWGLVFVRTLQEWNATPQLEEVASHLIQNILLRRDRSYAPICHQICQEFDGTFFHSLLTEKLLASLEEKAASKESDALYYLWGMLESLSDQPKKLAKTVARITSDQLFETVYTDSENLLETRRLLAFWKTLDQNKSAYEKLAQELLSYGQLFWKKEGFEEKGNRLFRLAVDFCVDKQFAQTRVEQFLTELYASAENCNMILRLSLIHDALDYFHVTIKEIASSEKLANHLADAEYLYDARNWAAAKTHAGWVLKLDPTNHRAKRLVGLSCFHMGEYSKAVRYLSELPVLDENVHKALAFSRVYSSQEPSEHLVQIDNIDSFDEYD
ncbi:MAG: DUF1347 family protein [Chlamydiales bacterium]|nr:DUF1347 family protein [Chlamydiales bacterium]